MKLIDLSDDESIMAEIPNLQEAEDVSESDSESVNSDPTAQAAKLKNKTNRDIFNNFLQRENATRVQLEAFDQTFTSKTSESQRPIIENPRDYQTELFERAKSENIIAVLDTGSGKTLIAALLMRHVAHQELEDRANGKQPKMSFFLVNSVHLVRQQQRMLANNLPTVPEALHGGVKDDLWKRVEWDGLKAKNQAIVCTAEILNQCLMHSFVKMEEINLLVFDEAHHAKKGHPYARIIKDYYLQTEPSFRPKIFGMTASPVDANTNLAQAAYTLEKLLDSTIVTAKSMSLFEHSPRPVDERWEYDELLKPFETDLYTQLQPVSKLIGLKAFFVFALDASSKLGKWCSDRVWHYALSEKETSKLLGRYENSDAYRKLENAQEKEEAIAIIRQAKDTVVGHLFQQTLQGTSEHLSSKVLLLYQKLSSFYEENENTRCIVFVEQRLTAQILADAFTNLKIPNLRSGVLVGVSGNSIGGQVETWKQHENTMDLFRAGIVNCIFATSVAEEGLDIPECNLVIRFDLYRTLIEYMQSRGRARMKNSVFVHMIERNNLNHDALVDWVIQSEEYLRGFCETLPEDRLLGHATVSLEKLLLKEKARKSFITEPAGAKCNFHNALVILARYSTSLQYVVDTHFDVYYEEEPNPTDKRDNAFRFKAVLPEFSGFDGEWGEPYPNKALAKRSAAWETCFALRAMNLLDENLDSVHQRRRPENANAHLAISDKQDEYDMKIKPDFWNANCGTIPNLLYPTIISLTASKSLQNIHAPLVMLTRMPLPPLPSFPVYLENNVQTMVKLEDGSPISVDREMLELMTSFTMAFYADLFHKTYDRQETRIGYWLAPMQERQSPPQQISGSLIDVQLLQQVHVAKGVRPTWVPGTSAATWLDQFLVDPLTGQYRYFSKTIVSGATIESAIPSFVKKRPKGSNNILSFTSSLWSNSKGKEALLKTADRTQPIIEAELVQLRRNFLDKMSEQEKQFSACVHIAPQPLQISLLGSGIARSGLVLPVIISRLDSYLITLEAFDKLDLNVSAELALEAFTKDSDNTDEYKEEQIQPQRGMGKNYERLEFIGDSLLKMTSTIMVYIKYPMSDEFGFHTRRMMMLCNSNLFNVSVNPSLNLPKYVRSRAFNRRTWYPEGMVLLGGKGASKEPDPAPVSHGVGKHPLGKKTVADVSEAIIGASVLATKSLKNKFDMAIRAISKLVDSDDHRIDSWDEFAQLYTPPAWQLDSQDPIAIDLAGKIKESMGYIFKYPRLLRSAFTHSSDQHTTVPDYQRLEFLGDAVLDMVCINWLFNKYDTKNPQWLTEHKMAMVSNKFLAAVAVKLGFDKHIKATSTVLLLDIGVYAGKVRAALEKPNVKRDFWTEIDHPPKSLSDLVESYLGAVVIDSGFDYGQAERFFQEHIYWFFEDIMLYDGFANRHPTTFLHKKLTEYGCMEYKLLCSDQPEGPTTVRITAGIIIHKDVVVTAESSGARYAKVRASQACLRLLDGLSISDFREKFGCNCREKNGG